MTKALWAIFFICFSLNAKAAISQFNITGFSQPETFNNTSGTTEIWGVFTGSSAPGETGVFNSCSVLDNSFKGCHRRAVSADTVINVSFVEDADFAGKKAVAIRVVNENNSTEFKSSNLTFSKGQTASLNFTWGELCSKIPNGSPNDGSCGVNGDIKLNFGIQENGTNLISTKTLTFKVYEPSLTDPNLMTPTNCGSGTTSGFCDFSLSPGDSGGFIDESLTKVNSGNVSYNKTNTSGAAETASINYTGLILFFNDQGHAAFKTLDEIPAIEFRLETPGSTNIKFNETEFDGLENDKVYYFTAASIDESGAITRLFDESYFTGCAADPACKYKLTASEIAGVIRENACFITTATYGSDQAHQVQTFRDFRKKFLWTSKIGIKIIKIYNTYGPLGAKFLNQYPKLKKPTRWFLTPFYLFAKASMSFGLGLSLLGLVLLSFGFVRLLRIYKMRTQ